MNQITLSFNAQKDVNANKSIKEETKDSMDDHADKKEGEKRKRYEEEEEDTKGGARKAHNKREKTENPDSVKRGHTPSTLPSSQSHAGTSMVLLPPASPVSPPQGMIDNSE